MLLLLLSLAHADPAPTPAPANPPIDLNGVWVAVARPTESTCMDTAEVSTYQWIVTMQVDGSLSVVVSGQTSFPKLFGSITGDTVSLYGLNKDSTAAGWLKLTVNGSTMTGVRRYLGTGAAMGKGLESTPCFIDYTVEVKR